MRGRPPKPDELSCHGHCHDRTRLVLGQPAGILQAMSRGLWSELVAVSLDTTEWPLPNQRDASLP